MNQFILPRSLEVSNDQFSTIRLQKDVVGCGRLLSLFDELRSIVVGTNGLDVGVHRQKQVRIHLEITLITTRNDLGKGQLRPSLF